MYTGPSSGKTIQHQRGQNHISFSIYLSLNILTSRKYPSHYQDQTNDRLRKINIRQRTEY